MTHIRLAGYQPQYFPRLHFFARILDADIFKVADNVQFVKRHNYPAADGSRGHQGLSYQAHTPIKVSSGVYELGVSVQHKGFRPINNIEVNYDHDWSRRHVRTINFAYARSANGKKIISQIGEFLQRKYSNLAELNMATILWALKSILGSPGLVLNDLTVEGVNALLQQPHPWRLKKMVIVSQTNIPPANDRRDATDSIIASCRILGADEYYHGGTAAAAYLDAARFQNSGIRLVQQQWECKEYRQQFPKVGFIPNLSIIDLLANEGHDSVVRILKGK